MGAEQRTNGYREREDALMESLREAWDANAADWIAWARSPEHDHAFWLMNLPALVDLLPPPRGVALDVACGEGRVARALKERGFEVRGIDISPALVHAARELDGAFDVTVGDAAAMPFASGTFDLAVCSLALMNMDDMPAVVRELARVLKHGAHLCLSVLHPLRTRRHAGRGSYFDAVRYAEVVRSGDAMLELNDTHRPLAEYFDALALAGFHIERLVEPVPSADYVASFPAVAAWREQPAFLHLRALAGARADPPDTASATPRPSDYPT